MWRWLFVLSFCDAIRLARPVHSPSTVRLGGKRSPGTSGSDAMPGGACGRDANARLRRTCNHDSAPFKPSRLCRMWRWDLSYRRIRAPFDLRGRKDAVTGRKRPYRESDPDALPPQKTVTASREVQSRPTRALSRCGTQTVKHVHRALPLR